eukprot:TRINITY_DN68145_c8_g1_i1.p1 TRINITY_DN68145_c8_g1~~TRINITY_DN68145_c8_g1_i1.p1  ORF type:complete len:748 (+),score=62.75 TRINITY_DN68145_c8_g1_i1:28-2271(+)
MPRGGDSALRQIADQADKLRDITQAISFCSQQQEILDGLRQNYVAMKNVLEHGGRGSIDRSPVSVPSFDDFLQEEGLTITTSHLVDSSVSWENRLKAFRKLSEDVLRPPINQKSNLTTALEHVEQLVYNSAFHTSSFDHGAVYELLDAYNKLTSMATLSKLTQEENARMRVLEEHLPNPKLMAWLTFPQDDGQQHCAAALDDTAWSYRHREEMKKTLQSALAPPSRHWQAEEKQAHMVEGYLDCVQAKMRKCVAAEEENEQFAWSSNLFQTAESAAHDFREQQNQMKETCLVEMRQTVVVLQRIKDQHIQALNEFERKVEASDSALLENATQQQHCWNQIAEIECTLKELAAGRSEEVTKRLHMEQQELHRKQRATWTISQLEKHGHNLHITAVACETAVAYVDFIDILSEAVATGVQQYYQERNNVIDDVLQQVKEELNLGYQSLVAAWRSTAINGGSRLLQHDHDLCKCMKSVHSQLKFSLETSDPNRYEHWETLQQLKAAHDNLQQEFEQLQARMNHSLEKYALEPHLWNAATMDMKNALCEETASIPSLFRSPPAITVAMPTAPPTVSSNSSSRPLYSAGSSSVTSSATNSLLAGNGVRPSGSGGSGGSGDGTLIPTLATGHTHPVYSTHQTTFPILHARPEQMIMDHQSMPSWASHNTHIQYPTMIPPLNNHHQDHSSGRHGSAPSWGHHYTTTQPCPPIQSHSNARTYFHTPQPPPPRMAGNGGPSPPRSLSAHTMSHHTN